MKCENFINELYESSLSHLDKSLMDHLQGCRSCEKEYLKIKQLEQSFLNGDKVPKKTSNMVRNFSVAMAVTCVLMFQGSFDQKEVQSIAFDSSQVALAYAMSETEDHLSQQIYDVDFSINPSLSENYYFDEVDKFDAYDFAITTIETEVYNNALEG